ncbi:M48 family metallopeptidase [Ureaplasma ceti]|uniref:M48 metallopeptidase family protein n=1 Tax=Ureaplasma ceti TaxID=3119530 RepID=UPI0033407F73
MVELCEQELVQFKNKMQNLQQSFSYLNFNQRQCCSAGVPIVFSQDLHINIDWNQIDVDLEYRKQLHKILANYLLSNNQYYFMNRLTYWFNLMQPDLNRSELPKVQFKWVSSKWGSYSKSKHLLCFNIKLLAFPVAYWDYIIIHELVHLVHYNHGTGFYSLLTKYCPNYLAFKKNLVCLV